MKKILVLTILCIGLFTQCKKDNTGSPYTPTCTGSANSYKNDVTPLIASYCSGCHSNYSSYSQVNGSKSSIRSVIVSGSMPKGSSMSDAERNKIVCWIDNGAPNN